MWNQLPGEEDIITITVFPDSRGGGTTGIWDPKQQAKRLAADLAWILKAGGTITVVVGGAMMVVGGYTAWTGGGAGLFAVGASVTLVGAGAAFVGFMLDEVAADPPQPGYNLGVNHIDAGIDLTAFGVNPMAPEMRAMDHLNHLSVLAVNILDAIERLQGAEAAGDTRWVNAWGQTIKTLEGMFLSRQRGLANALSDMAASSAAMGNIPGKKLAEGLAMLQSTAGRQNLDKAFKEASVPEAIADRVLKHLGGMTASDLPESVNLGQTLKLMADTLTAQAETRLAQF